MRRKKKHQLAARPQVYIALERNGKKKRDRKYLSQRAPDAAHVLSNLARVRTLELGKLRRALDLEEHLVSAGRDDLSKKCGTGSLSRDIPILLTDTERDAYFYIDRFRTFRFDFGLGCRFLGHCDSSLDGAQCSKVGDKVIEGGLSSLS